MIIAAILFAISAPAPVSTGVTCTVINGDGLRCQDKATPIKIVTPTQPSRGRRVIATMTGETPPPLSAPMAAWNRFIADYVQSGLPDLTNRQMAIFLRVAMQNGPHTVRGLAAGLNLSKPVITRALNKLSQLGYLCRQRDLTDRRNVIIAPTDKGAQFLDHIGTLGQ